MSDGVCQHCGGPLPPATSPGPPRKWCSERCRKRQYEKPCVDCGKLISGTTPGRSKGRCVKCAHKIPRPADIAHRERIEKLWAEGKTQREILVIMGMAGSVTTVANWRQRGYDLPHRRTPEQIARITAGSAERLAKARRVWKEMRENAA